MSTARLHYLRKLMQRSKPLSRALAWDRYVKLRGIGMPDDQARRLAGLSAAEVAR